MEPTEKKFQKSVTFIFSFRSFWLISEQDTFLLTATEPLTIYYKKPTNSVYIAIKMKINIKYTREKTNYHLNIYIHTNYVEEIQLKNKKWRKKIYKKYLKTYREIYLVKI